MLTGSANNNEKKTIINLVNLFADKKVKTDKEQKEAIEKVFRYYRT